jgi:5'(3')-deoxyribonucleotidase
MRIYVDMDGVLANYKKAFLQQYSAHNPYPQSRYGFFTDLEPMPDAIESFQYLQQHHDVWILTRPSFKNPLCYTEKRIWVEKKFGIDTCEKFIISPDKSLFIGDILIDDYPHHNFPGEQILFGSASYPDWRTVINYIDAKG